MKRQNVSKFGLVSIGKIFILTLLIFSANTFAMKKADFIKAGFIVTTETASYIVFKGKDGKDYFVLKSELDD